MYEQPRGVQVARAAIRRWLENNGGDSVFLVFKADSVNMRDASAPEAVALMTATSAAVETANEVLPDDVWAEGPLLTPVGPFINLDWIGTDEQNNAWLTTFASGLVDRGYNGTVTVAPQARFPRWYSWDRETPRLTTYTAYQMSEPLPPRAQRGPNTPGLGVDPATTRALCDNAVAWGSLDGADTYVGHEGAIVKLNDPQVEEILVTGMDRHWGSRVYYIANKSKKARSIDFDQWGQVVYQITEPNAGWAGLIAEATAALTQNAQALDLGFIRYSQTTAISWRDLEAAFPKLPYVDGTKFYYARQLWDQYVPDAHAVQVLTGRHLEKAASLRSWNVTQLSEDRFLVQAADLTPWFDGPVISYAVADGRGLYVVDPTDPAEKVVYAAREPEPEVIAAARADFGDMIMTEEMAIANEGW